MNGPTAEQAEALALLLWAGVSATEAIPFVAPVVDAATWPELVKRWPRAKPVLDARIRLQGGPWTALTDDQKRALAIQQAHRCQAWILASQHPSELTAQQANLWKDCLASLERVQAGTAGKADASTEFFEKFTREFAQRPTRVKQPPGVQ